MHARISGNTDQSKNRNTAIKAKLKIQRHSCFVPVMQKSHQLLTLNFSHSIIRHQSGIQFSPPQFIHYKAENLSSGKGNLLNAQSQFFVKRTAYLDSCAAPSQSQDSSASLQHYRIPNTKKKSKKKTPFTGHGTNLLESLQEMENSKDPVLFMA